MIYVKAESSIYLMWNSSRKKLGKIILLCDADNCLHTANKILPAIIEKFTNGPVKLYFLLFFFFVDALFSTS